MLFANISMGSYLMWWIKTCLIPAIFALSSSISLSSVLEPVADLGRRQAGEFGEVLLLSRWRVRVVRVPLSQRRPRLLLEAVRRLLAVPDRTRQRELSSDAVLTDGAERSTSRLLGLSIVSLYRTRFIELTTSCHGRSFGRSSWLHWDPDI